MNQKGYLVLADGKRFEGRCFGAPSVAVGEAVFTTGMTGYQEVITDPSYCGQIVTMTAAQIGNTGVNAEDDEATKPFVAGFVIRDRSPISSNWRATEDLHEYLTKRGIAALSDVDTRALTRHIRDHGAQMAAMGAEDPATLHDRALAAEPMTGQNLATRVTTETIYTWNEGEGTWTLPATRSGSASLDEPPQHSHHVVAVDYGVKHSILRCLVDVGCRVTVVPASTSAEEVLALDPDGVFLSNGPGDPAAVREGITMVKDLLGKRPLFGICLGHQILSLALGGNSYKLKFGHRGLNQPVKDLSTGRIEVTSQNHGFAVDVKSLEGRCAMTHVHLNDGTCEGIEHPETGAFSVQYHPEASAGTHDARYLFKRFIDRMNAAR